jgi:hypothetical protein
VIQHLFSLGESEDSTTPTQKETFKLQKKSYVIQIDKIVSIITGRLSNGKEIRARRALLSFPREKYVEGEGRANHFLRKTDFLYESLLETVLLLTYFLKNFPQNYSTHMIFSDFVIFSQLIGFN